MDTTGGEGLRVAVVAGQWHATVMAGLLDGALRAITDAAAIPTVIRVPGAFELPLAALTAADAGYDTVVALGVVIRGGTPHFDYVCSAATTGLTDVALRTRVPVGFGLLTCDDESQALDRSGGPTAREDKGYEVAAAAIATAVTLRAVIKGEQ
jgi:6,7-dimethyl-8-ribityllumazine synthase